LIPSIGLPQAQESARGSWVSFNFTAFTKLTETWKTVV